MCSLRVCLFLDDLLVPFYTGLLLCFLIILASLHNDARASVATVSSQMCSGTEAIILNRITECVDL